VRASVSPAESSTYDTPSATPTSNPDSCTEKTPDPAAQAAPADPDLAAVVETWARLPEGVRQTILIVVRAHRTGT